MSLFTTLVTAIPVLVSGFTGNWTGDGYMRTPRANEPCAYGQVEIEQTPESISVQSGVFVCGEQKLALNPISFDIRGEYVYLGGDTVGTYDGQKLSAQWEEDGFRRNVVIQSGSNDTLTFETVAQNPSNFSDLYLNLAPFSP